MLPRQWCHGSAFEVDAGGRAGACRIKCLNTTGGVPILVSVQSLAQMGAIMEFSTGAAFFRHLADQSFVQLENDADVHLCLALVEDLLARPVSDEGQHERFIASAEVLEGLKK